MGASSSDDDDESQPSDDVDESRSFVTMDSSASDIICLFEARSTCGSSFVSSSSVRSCSSWTTNNDSVVESADRDVESGPERVDLVFAGDDIDSTDDCSLHEGGAQVGEECGMSVFVLVDAFLWRCSSFLPLFCTRKFDAPTSAG